MSEDPVYYDEPATFAFYQRRDNKRWQAISEQWKTWDGDKEFNTRADAKAAVKEFLLNSQEAQRLWFWDRAKCLNTYRAQGRKPNTDRIQEADHEAAAKAGLKLIKVRRYRDNDTGETRRTIELELTQ